MIHGAVVNKGGAYVSGPWNCREDEQSAQKHEHNRLTYQFAVLLSHLLYEEVDVAGLVQRRNEDRE